MNAQTEHGTRAGEVDDQGPRGGRDRTQWGLGVADHALIGLRRFDIVREYLEAGTGRERAEIARHASARALGSDGAEAQAAAAVKYAYEGNVGGARKCAERALEMSGHAPGRTGAGTEKDRSRGASASADDVRAWAKRSAAVGALAPLGHLDIVRAYLDAGTEEARARIAEQAARRSDTDTGVRQHAARAVERAHAGDAEGARQHAARALGREPEHAGPAAKGAGGGAERGRGHSASALARSFRPPNAGNAPRTPRVTESARER